MDLSKLPKLSQTQQATPEASPSSPAPSPATTPAATSYCRSCGLPLRAGASFCDGCGSPTTRAPAGRAAIGAEVWISVAMGILLLILAPHTLGYFSSKIFHTTFEPYPDPTRPFPAKCDFLLYDDGTKIYYRDTMEFWSDLAITAFAMTLIADGIVMALARRPLPVLCVFVLTCAATLGNLFYLVRTMNNGFPIISALAVIFGVYLAIQQWRQFQTLRHVPA
ncbi:MAG TPA: hypothetical protein VHS31_15380 [Tepidisphaeraceae bacterium]|jgi:hypothetical protein|nr:hypothetical protein [Tepidisphaeraceae bacterium]